MNPSRAPEARRAWREANVDKVRAQDRTRNRARRQDPEYRKSKNGWARAWGRKTRQLDRPRLVLTQADKAALGKLLGIPWQEVRPDLDWITRQLEARGVPVERAS